VTFERHHLVPESPWLMTRAFETLDAVRVVLADEWPGARERLLARLAAHG
jgi:hypothetical protein